MNAAEITRQSKSNLALAFVSLKRDQRREITIFYAFCRVIDDIADTTEISAGEKQQGLNEWRGWLRAAGPGEPALAGDLRSVLARHGIAPEMLDEIITGVEMDLRKSRYATFDELRTYCYHVASAVGLVSIEIFGYKDPKCKEYAVQLGLALQMTNIIRDVRKDLERDRIYLPKEDLDRFGYSETALQRRDYNAKFVELMEFEAARARQFFQNAADLLPAGDRHSMVAAEIMSSVYRALLRRMENDRFRVFEKDYRLTRLEKAGRVAGQLLKSL